jgi:hypothetical protein
MYAITLNIDIFFLSKKNLIVIQSKDTISHLCWSDNDPWVFASIGYDNKFVIHQIPYEERYKILM